jgi:fluoride exporter
VRVLIQIGLVAVGSALGGLTRWGVTLAFARLLGVTFPWGTLFINISGSLFLGWVTTYFRARLFESGIPWLHPDDLRLMLAVGFTGAYTTFSTFEYEAHELLRDEDSWRGLCYLFASVLLGLLAVRLGILLARSR